MLDALEANGAAALRRTNMRDFLLREQQLLTTIPDRITRLARVAYAITDRVTGHRIATGAA